MDRGASVEPLRKRTVFRADERVRVVVPKFVTRIGYPKTVSDYVPEVRRLAGEHFRAAVAAVVGQRALLDGEPPVMEEMAFRLAYALAVKDGFGGRQRELHFVELPEYASRESRILEVRTAVTGTYWPGRAAGGWGEAEWDYTPPTLEDRKHHRLAVLGIMHETEWLVAPVEHLVKVEG